MRIEQEQQARQERVAARLACDRYIHDITATTTLDSRLEGVGWVRRDAP